MQNSLSAQDLTPQTLSIYREGYNLDAFRADAMAGLTVAIVAIPLSLALAIGSGLSPEKGLYTAIIGGFIISLLGGSRYQIGGPAGAFIVLITAILGRHGYDGLLLATFIGGVLMMLMGWLRLGALIRHIPKAVLVGFAAGIAIIIFASQIKELLGLALIKEPAALLPKLQTIAGQIGEARPVTMLVAALTLAIIILLRHYRPSWPGMLIAVGIAAALTALLQLDIATIGTRFGALPQGLPMPTLPDWTLAKLAAVLPDAIAIALLGAIESLMSATVADEMSGTQHRPNGELVAQGAANMAVICFSGMCVTGTLARTATNIRAGAKTPVAGMLHAAFLLIFMLVAAPLASHIPLAALAAMLTVVCWNLAEKDEFIHHTISGWKTSLVLLTTFGLTLFVDVIVGIAVGTMLHFAINRDP